jgi:DNA end-binding protein Ku
VTWKGAIAFAGIVVHIALYNRVKSRTSESFRMLAPNGRPIAQVLQDSDGKIVDRDQVRKGVAAGPDEWTALSEEAANKIAEGERSKILDPSGFAPLDTIPLELATASYEVRADEKVAGADRSVNVLWNGLRAAKLAFVTQITVRSGSRDAILVLWADDRGLWATALPFEAECNGLSQPGFTEDERAADLFSRVIGASYTVKPFAHADYVSDYATRRQAVIDAVLAGKEVEAPASARPEAEVVDLMAALEALAAARPETKTEVEPSQGAAA